MGESGLTASFRDPENAAFRHEGAWFRIAAPTSARALRLLRGGPLYDELVEAGDIVAFDEADDDRGAAVLSAYRAAAGREPQDGTVVFSVAQVDPITYPWEWPNRLLSAAGLATLDLRERLLGVGLDLKDASAFNVQFAGLRPVFVDLGSVEEWRPNPSWNAARQFVEHFINPLAVGSADRVTSADAWALSRGRGLRSESARALMPGRQRRSLSLTLVQAMTRPVERNVPSETAFANQARGNVDLARKATLSLTRRLRKQVTRLQRDAHTTTWVDYGTRSHYGSEDLDRKSAFAEAFVTADPGRSRLVLDVGGNDGFTATHLVRHTDARVVVMDADAGALDVLTKGALGTADLRGRITPLLGDLTNLTPGSGLLGREFSPFVDRVRPSAVICQAVLHHVVITQGTPMPWAVDALAAFGAPVEIEFATEDDEKTRLLLDQIPNWRGTYSTAALLDALERRFRRVEVRGTTSPTRVVVDAWDLVA